MKHKFLSGLVLFDRPHATIGLISLPYGTKSSTIRFFKRVRIRARLIVSVLACLVLIAGCSKISRDFVSKDALIEQMSNDEDVLMYYTLMKDHTAQLGITDQFERFKPYLNDTALLRQKREEYFNERINVMQNAGQTIFIIKQAVKIRERYNLNKYPEGDVKDIFEKVYDNIDHNKSLKNRKLERKKLSASRGFFNCSGFASYSRVFDSGDGCTDWYWVTTETNTGATVSEIYLYTSCPGAGGGSGGGGGGRGGDIGVPGPIDNETVDETADKCYATLLLNVDKCDRQSLIDTSKAYVLYIAAVALSGGTFAAPATAAWLIAIGYIILQHSNCVNDAWASYHICLQP